MGVFGASAWEDTLYGADRSGVRRGKDPGPRPELWDVYLGAQSLRKGVGRALKWEDLKVCQLYFYAGLS